MEWCKGYKEDLSSRKSRILEHMGVEIDRARYIKV